MQELSTREAARKLGAYYTGLEAAVFVARAAIGSGTTRILEPSFGDGSFLRAANYVASPTTEIYGVEIVEESLRRAVRQDLIRSDRALSGDFLSIDPFPVDLVIGNPPYVRLRHLGADAALRALRSTVPLLASPMATSGSLWMPFVLHAIRFLRKGGNLALVLPFEMTHVKYARPLWQLLGQSFERLHIIRVRERLFPDILQDVLLFFANGFGGTCSTVRFDSHRRVTDLGGVPETSVDIPIAALVGGEREFTRGLLPQALRDLLQRIDGGATLPVRERCAFNIGYVSGDKKFFHPSRQDVARYALSESSLLPAATTARSLRGVGVRTTSIPDNRLNRLYRPHPDRLTEGDSSYISTGEAMGVALRYKCRVRKPWYLVPGVSVPDLVMSVFSSDPIVLINDAKLVASNSLLCGRLTGSSGETFVAGWYTPLTRLYSEIEIHSLGGGVMVTIPGEVGRIRIPRSVRSCPSRLSEIDRLLTAGRIVDAYETGGLVLQESLDLSPSEINLIRDGAEVLANWRSGYRGHASSSSPRADPVGIRGSITGDNREIPLFE